MFNDTQPLFKHLILPLLGLICLFLVALKFPNPTLWLCLGILSSAWITGDRFPHRNVTARQMLHFSIVLMGFGVPLAEVIHVGFNSIPVTFISIAATMTVGILLYRKLRIDAETGFLLTVGTTICGGSAIAAVSGAIDADSKTIAKSTIIVFTLNSIALILFPTLGHWMQMGVQQFGYWAALAIHDTSSVVGAASTFGEQSLHTAILIKLTRSLWILPLTVVASFTKGNSNRKIRIPWFILGFILTAGIAAYAPKLHEIWHRFSQNARPMFAISLFLIGTQMNFRELRQSLNRELLMAVLLWIFVSVVSAVFIMRYVA